MSEFLKPQSPLQHKDGAYIYPLTTSDQVILEDNTRLNVALEDIKDKVNNIDFSNLDLEGIAYIGETLDSAVAPINADTLGGRPAEYYATKDDVQAIPLGIEYGGTGATNAVDARKNLGITPENIGALSMDLLWENASPTSEFIEQTISLDLNEYSFVVICFVASAGATTYVATGFIMVGGGFHAEEYIANSGSVHKRHFKAETSGVRFENGRQDSTSGAQYMIPVKIYGVKGVSV